MSADSEKTSSAEGEQAVEEMTKEVEIVDIGGEAFSLVRLADQFNKCQETAGLSLREYVEGYKEVYKFLCLMGTVFGWVGSDVYAKYTTLEKYLIGDKKEEYQNIKTMIDYEVKNNLVKTKKKDDPSGSRTLLRLHRALEYITAFLDRLEGMKDEDYCSVTSREAYETTLMKYHPWVVQKAAKLGMGLLPTKKGLVAKVCPDGDVETLRKAEQDFPKAVEAMRSAYNATQVFYQEHNLLDIP